MHRFVLLAASTLFMLALGASRASTQPRAWQPVYPTVLGVTLEEPAQDVHARLGPPRSTKPTAAGVTEVYLRNGGATRLELTNRNGRIVGIYFTASGQPRSPATDPYGVTVNGDDFPGKRGPCDRGEDVAVYTGCSLAWTYSLDQNGGVWAIGVVGPDSPRGPVQLAEGSGDGRDPAHAVAPLVSKYSEMAAFENDYIELSRCEGGGLWNKIDRTQAVVRRSGGHYEHWKATCTTSRRVRDIYFDLSRLRGGTPLPAQTGGVLSAPQPWVPAVPIVYGFRFGDDEATVAQRFGPPGLSHKLNGKTTADWFLFPNGTNRAVHIYAENGHIVQFSSEPRASIHPQLGHAVPVDPDSVSAFAPDIGASADNFVAHRGVYANAAADSIDYGSFDGMVRQYGVSSGKITSVYIFESAPSPTVILLRGSGDGSAPDRAVRAQVAPSQTKRFEALFIEQIPCDAGGGGEWQLETRSLENGFDRVRVICSATGAERSFYFKLSAP